jgi:plastocyanin
MIFLRKSKIRLAFLIENDYQLRYDLIIILNYTYKGATSMKRNLYLTLATSFMIVLGGANAYAADGDYVITLKDNVFSPAELVIPAGQKIKLTVKNLQSKPAEFESSDLDREKVVEANDEIIVLIGPLDAGKYGYFDDFHRDTTATIIAK